MLADKMYPDLRPTDLRTFSAHIIELTCIAIIYFGLAKLSLALASIHPARHRYGRQRGMRWEPYCCADTELLPQYFSERSSPMPQLQDRSGHPWRLRPATRSKASQVRI